MPHIIELSPFKKASDFDTAPNFIQHVPPLKFVHAKWVQPNILPHLPPQSSAFDKEFDKSPPRKSQANAHSAPAPSFQLTDHNK